MRLAEGLMREDWKEGFGGVCYFDERYHNGFV
jgi:hypothetical protein